MAPGAVQAPIADLTERARKHAIPVLDLRPVLEPIVSERGRGAAFHFNAQPGLGYGSGHMSPAGSAAAAEAIASAVRAPAG